MFCRNTDFFPLDLEMGLVYFYSHLYFCGGYRLIRPVSGRQLQNRLFLFLFHDTYGLTLSTTGETIENLRTN